VTDIEELRQRGRDKSYYQIELASPPRTSVMIPVSDAEGYGVREALSGSKLKRVWRVVTKPHNRYPMILRHAVLSCGVS
jgi:RNA polymerase-interacting CarD/CdnL/TRCF family regulator